MILFVGGQMFNLVPATVSPAATGGGGRTPRWAERKLIDDLLWIWEANQDAEEY